MYYNFGTLLRYTVGYSRYLVLSSSWRDVVGLSGSYQPVNLYTIDPIPQNGIAINRYQMTAVLYPGWGISPRGQGFVVTEEFRTHTVVAMLASLGGLWTILSAVFFLLFGRSVLFPIFGNMPISPFGLIGNLSTRFKEALEENFGKSIRAQIHDMGLNQFMWDFIIDMSPLEIPKHGAQTPSDFQEPEPLYKGV